MVFTSAVSVSMSARITNTSSALVVHTGNLSGIKPTDPLGSAIIAGKPKQFVFRLLLA